ncbi:MAG TPA: AI-2E family transporter, partial [Tepidisphaeraceae bacterium]
RDEQARSDRHVQTVCLLILAFWAVESSLQILKPVLVPFVLALFFAACLKPLIKLQRIYLRFPQPLAVAGALIFALVVLGAIGIPVGMAMSKSWPAFAQQFDDFMKELPEKLPLQRLGLRPFNVQLPASAFIDKAPSWFFEVTGAASGTLLVIIFTLFILLGRRASAPYRKNVGLLAEIENRVQQYITKMVMLSAVSGIGVGIVLAACGVKFAVMFGFLAFLLNFIPTVGSIIATLLPLPVILLSRDMGPTAMILALAIPAAIQIYLGNAVQPRVLGNALDLHPIVVLISLVFWGMIWGLPGAFLATPMTAVLRIVLDKIPATRPIAELLAGRIEAVF